MLLPKASKIRGPRSRIMAIKAQSLISSDRRAVLISARRADAPAKRGPLGSYWWVRFSTPSATCRLRRVFLAAVDTLGAMEYTRLGSSGLRGQPDRARVHEFRGAGPRYQSVVAGR